MDEENPAAEISSDNEEGINQGTNFTHMETPATIVLDRYEQADKHEKKLFKFDLLILINYK